MREPRRPYLKDKEVYSSIAMLHPDGTVMCMCSNEKAEWYVSRGLASMLDANSFQLNFAPNGYGNFDNPFYLEKKENACTVCGAKDALTKHHVVPYQFRKLFPVKFKSHDHHDVLLLCRECHDIYERHADDLKDMIYETIGFDIKKIRSIRKHNSKIRYSQKTLASHGAVIPLHRLEELQKNALKEIIPLEGNEDKWEKLFVGKYNTENEINDFCALWRQHFIDFAKPKYLSSFFNVNHKTGIK